MRLVALGGERARREHVEAEARIDFVADHAEPVGEQMADAAGIAQRLGARFGLRRVTRLMPQDTHIPEFAVAAVGAGAVATLPPRSGEAGSASPL